jgi:hypothetical protein
MKTAQKVVKALVEGFNIRELIRAGLPRQKAKRQIAKVFDDLGWTILSMSDQGYRSAVGVAFKVNDERLQGGEHYVRAEILDKLDASLSGAMPGVYKKASFPATGWLEIEGGNEGDPPQRPARPLFYTVVIQVEEGYGSDYGQDVGESDSRARDLVRAGLPKGSLIRQITRAFTREGCKVLSTSTEGYQNSVAVKFTTPDDPTVWSMATTYDLKSLGDRIERRLRQMLGGRLQATGMPTSGWTTQERDEVLNMVVTLDHRRGWGESQEPEKEPVKKSGMTSGMKELAKHVARGMRGHDPFYHSWAGQEACYVSAPGDHGKVPHSELAMHTRIAGRTIRRYALFKNREGHIRWAHVETQKPDGDMQVTDGGLGEVLTHEIRQKHGL